MATGPIETHLHRSLNWENGAPGARMGPRGRSASCGNGLSAQCVRLRSEINQYGTCHNLRPTERRVKGIIQPQEVFHSGPHEQTHLASSPRLPPFGELPPSSLGES